MESAVIHGYGTVGKATDLALDIPYHHDIEGGNITLDNSAKLRYHFVCIPTPFDGYGYDTSALYDLVCYLVTHGGTPKVFIIRSTVLPKTCRALMRTFRISGVVHVPEFLTESTWEEDAKYPEQIVVGSDTESYQNEVVGIFSVALPGIPIVKTDTITAELIKCARNAFFSTKVVFANEMYEVAQRIGADYGVVRDALYRNEWIGENHLDAVFQRPSWDAPRRGLHGKCLPKDLKALAAFSGSELLKVVEELNERYIKEGTNG